MFETIENENEKIYLIREFDILQQIKLFEEQIEFFILNDHRDIVFDLGRLESVDSAFLSAIVRFRTKLSLGGRYIRIINYNEHVYKCFQLLHLDDYLLG